MKKHALLIALGLAMVVLFLGDAAKFYRLGFVQYIDAKQYDYRLRLTLPNTGDDRIVIVDVDDKIKHRNVVLGYDFRDSARGSDKSGVLPEPVFPAEIKERPVRLSNGTVFEPIPSCRTARRWPETSTRPWNSTA